MNSSRDFDAQVPNQALSCPSAGHLALARCRVSTSIAQLKPSENSSGKQIRRGSITKTGNAHLRRIVVEAVWSYQRPPAIWAGLRKRQQSASEAANEIAWKAQHRLHKRYVRLAAAGKDKRKIVTAIGRELLDFIWAIGTKAEAAAGQRIAA